MKNSNFPYESLNVYTQIVVLGWPNIKTKKNTF